MVENVPDTEEERPFVAALRKPSPRPPLGAHRVGDLSIDPVWDGRMLLPAAMLYPDRADGEWNPHREQLDPDGNVILELGAYLVRSGGRTVLIDAGMGNLGRTGFGILPESLAELGVRLEDVTDVVLTHLHFDHTGWISADGAPFFPRATVRCHQADLDHFLEPDADPHGTATLIGVEPVWRQLAAVADRIETWDTECAVAPGVSVIPAPGHTPGSSVIAVSSGRERALILGDLVHCPIELTDPEWGALGDVDPVLARKTREVWSRQMDAEGTTGLGSHFASMRFGRVLGGDARSWAWA